MRGGISGDTVDHVARRQSDGIKLEQIQRRESMATKDEAGDGTRLGDGTMSQRGLHREVRHIFEDGEDGEGKEKGAMGREGGTLAVRSGLR
jgi:hypothetical protein